MKIRDGYGTSVAFEYSLSKGQSHRFEISVDNGKPFVYQLGLDEYFGDYRSSEYISELTTALAAGSSARIAVNGIEYQDVSLAGSADALRKLESCTP